MSKVPPQDEPATIELMRSRPSAALADRDARLRDALPGLEPDRDVTDWGRSYRMSRLADRTVAGFLYHYWFRVAAEGVENVPDSGGVLLVANRAGPLPVDATMIAKAVREEHPAGRTVVPALSRTWAEMPFLGMAATKLGAVSAHPANLHRLLFDERRPVLVFPEAEDAAAKPLRWRYRLRRLAGTGFVESAYRAGVPIVPVAVLGSEEAMPTILPTIARLPLSSAFPLPAKFRLRFLEPVWTDRLARAAEAPERPVTEVAEDIRSLIQENLLEMVGERRSVWLG